MTQKQIFQYHKDRDLRKIKQLGTILEEGAEMSRRKHLAQFALAKYRKIWKNKFVSAKRKLKIYNVYLRPILLYNCSMCRNNLTISKNLDVLHSRQLRKCLDIHYPKILKNDRLYAITKGVPISEHNETRRKVHMGNFLRRNHPIRRLLFNIKK